jgi:hypothetical protein
MEDSPEEGDTREDHQEDSLAAEDSLEEEAPLCQSLSLPHQSFLEEGETNL